jgi:hypothetical protein
MTRGDDVPIPRNPILARTRSPLIFASTPATIGASLELPSRIGQVSDGRDDAPFGFQLHIDRVDDRHELAECLEAESLDRSFETRSDAQGEGIDHREAVVVASAMGNGTRVTEERGSLSG